MDFCLTGTQIIMPSENCAYPQDDDLFRHYHDAEWGVPTFNDQAFFEKICLEGFQSGLSWKTILHRREGFRQAFDYFSPETIATYTDTDIHRLVHDRRIIRNRRKILSAVNNAKRFLELQSGGGSLAELCWSFEPAAGGRVAIPDRQWLLDHPFTAESRALAQRLKQQGWSFVGPTNMYALMQALGIVNDHVGGCPRRMAISQLREQAGRVE